MDKYIKSYVDNQVIRPYKYNDVGYYDLQIQDLPHHEQLSLIDVLFDKDPTVRDMILDYAQSLINERLPIVEAEDRYIDGLYTYKDKVNGEARWTNLKSLGGI